MINQFIANGRTTKDIELKYTKSQIPVAMFTLAVNRSFKNASGDYDTDFINCIAYRGTAELLNKYVKKGDLIGIEGRLQTRSYEKDDKKVYVSEIIIENIDFLASNNNTSSETKIIENEPKNELESKKNIYQEDIVLNDEDLPF